MNIEYYSVAKLPSDIILFEIFPRLPAKSLMRFRCVCKSWSSLIRHPLFVRIHQNLQTARSRHNYHLLLRPWNSSELMLSAQLNLEEMSLSTTSTFTISTSRHERFSLLSINGLVCIYNRHDHYFPHKLVIFNLCTQDSITLPQDLTSTGASCFRYQLHSACIGFSPQTNETKILQILCHESSFVFNIFTLGGTWRRLEIQDKDLGDVAFDCDDIFWPNLELGCDSVFLHGARHWLEMSIEGWPVVLVFDFEQERFRVIPFPEEYHKAHSGASRLPSWKLDMIEVNGCVAAYEFDFSNGGLGNVVTLWILKDYQHLVWVKESIIIPRKWNKLQMRFIPKCSIYTDELLLKGGFWGKKVYLHNLNNKRFTTTQISIKHEILGCYHESIISFDASPCDNKFSCGSLEENTDLVLRVGDTDFHIHKSIFSGKSNRLRKMILKDSSAPLYELPDFPGGAEVFLYIHKLCYGIRGPMNASTSLPFLCAAEYMELEDALIQQTMKFLEEPTLYDYWEICAELLKSCKDPKVLEYANKCGVVEKCTGTIESHASLFFLKTQLSKGSSSQIGGEEKKTFLEQVAPLYFSQVCPISNSKLLLGLHRSALSLHASQQCVECIERCIDAHLHRVPPQDFYRFDINTVQRLANHYLYKHEGIEEIATNDNAIVLANLVDAYLLNNAANNLSVAQFQKLADSVRHARAVEDNLYFAIALYLQLHPYLAESEREQICQSLTCKILTPEVRINAAKSRVLSLRTIIELNSLNNEELKHDVQQNKRRISALEITILKMNDVIENLKKEEEKLGTRNLKGSNKWTTMFKKLGFKKKLVCTTSQDVVHNPNPMRKDNIGNLDL